MYISQQMQDLIASGVTKATNHAIEDLAKQEGMVTLLQDGILKTLAGLTTLDEVYKVVES